MSEEAGNSERSALLFDLAQAAGDPETGIARITEILERHAELRSPETVEQLAELARTKVRVDAVESLRYAEAALAIARGIGDDQSEARGKRAKANSLWFLNQNRPAVELYEQAIWLYGKCGNETEIGRTMSSAIQPLIRLGEYDRAVQWVEQARAIFSRKGDTQRLARLELNAANIYHRQDRFAEALDAYESAYRQLLPFRDTEATAAALHNMAVCLISLNDFERAVAAHLAARAFCEEHGMPALVVQSDYNVAYLYYLRGEYSRALDGLRATREAAAETSDSYHGALCSMDQSEIYIELNLIEEASEMAQEAFVRFQELGMNYEAARSLVNLAIALGHRGNAARSLELFSQAREMLVREQNRIWPSLIDLYQAVVLYHEGRNLEAAPLCANALSVFREVQMGSKEVLSHLVLGQIGLSCGDGALARMHGDAALQRLEGVEAPHLVYQSHVLMARIEELAGDSQTAAAWYRSAQSAAESLRDVLRNEELKIAFMKNKLEAYESLICLALKETDGRRQPQEIFECMEQAKSRSLRDLMGSGSQERAEHDPETDLARQIRERRRELNWFYHRIEAEQLGQDAPADGSLARLRATARDLENTLMQLLRDMPAEEAAAPARTVDAIRAALGPGTILVEYFYARDQLIVAVLSEEVLEVIPLCDKSRVDALVRLLEFQFSKFRLGANYVNAFGSPMLRATQTHLRKLHDLLLEPIRGLLRGKHLVFVPHDSLHHVPLHALFDGRRYVIDEFTVSYSPSASIYALCHQRTANARGASLVLGVPDSTAPLIAEEAAVVAATLPGAELFLGSAASQRILMQKGPASRVIHIATHGRFRADNPMFSAIRLGDGYLTLYDLLRFRLPAELVTLSGCSTGLNVVAKGDELLGLVRGLLHSGARSLLLSLWDVHDRSTTELMQSFYTRFGADGDKAAALRGAMQELREKHPHPYFWAPFVLIGGV
uniref:TPR repeat-containing protein n=1 Tax=Solibacter usitatus (strain Ellin6076) TaxID=234267 RepID=Q022I9_SOLUE